MLSGANYYDTLRVTYSHYGLASLELGLQAFVSCTPSFAKWVWSLEIIILLPWPNQTVYTMVRAIRVGGRVFDGNM